MITSPAGGNAYARQRGFRMQYAETSRLFLIGPPRLETGSGGPVSISSKKAFALLALLATAERFERSRVWLQQMLWGSRAAKQAQSSLRRELSNLRKCLKKHDLNLIESDQRTVRLMVDQVAVDCLDRTKPIYWNGFLEGMDIAGEDGFEDWLRDIRGQSHDPMESSDAALSTPSSSDRRIAPRDTKPQLKAQIAIMPTLALERTDLALDLAKQTSGRLAESMAKLRWLPVLFAGSIAEGAEQSQDYERISKALGARYLGCSEIGEADGRLFVHFSLLEMPGRIIRWSETRDLGKPSRLSTQLSTLEREISRTVNCFAATFDHCEQSHVVFDADRRAEDLPIICWKVRFLIGQFTRESFASAERILDTALARFPASSELLMLRANLALWVSWAERNRAEYWSALAPMIRAATRADPADARGPLFMGILNNWQKNSSVARRHLQQACELDPSSAQAFAHLGASLSLAGRPQEALEPLTHAVFLSPIDPHRFFPLGELATALWMLDRHEEALETARTIQITHPGYVLAHILETASLSALGRFAEAASAHAKLLADNLRSCRQVLEWIPFEDRKWADRLSSAIDMDHADAQLLMAHASG